MMKKNKEFRTIASYDTDYCPEFAYCIARCLNCSNSQSCCTCPQFDSPHTKHTYPDVDYYCTDHTCLIAQAEIDADSDFAYFKDSFRECLNANFNRVKVFGHNLDWRNSSGIGEFENLTIEEVMPKIISPRLSSFRVDLIVPKANEDVLFTPQNPFPFEISLYHHDCPSGSHFTFERLPTSRAILNARKTEIIEFHKEQEKKRQALASFMESQQKA